MPATAMVQIAAVASACLIALVVAFQLALATGARWGAAAYGGRFVQGDGRLPTRYRLSSAVAALVHSGAAWLVLVAGSAIGRGPVPEAVLTASSWALAVLFALNTLVNLSERHPVERFGAGALTAVPPCCAACCTSRATEDEINDSRARPRTRPGPHFRASQAGVARPVMKFRG
jgi:hypothetical protein